MLKLLFDQETVYHRAMKEIRDLAMAEGEAKGMNIKLLENLKNLMESLSWDFDQAANALKLNDTEREYARKILQPV